VVALFLAGCVGALVTRGWGHEGRFSIHLFGAAAALCGWALGRLWSGSDAPDQHHFPTRITSRQASLPDKHHFPASVTTSAR
jgi:hypothetical protein